MRRNLVFAACLIFAACLAACSEMKSMTGQTGNLTALLSQQLGVSEAQAGGGVGAMLKLAQENLLAGALK